MTTKPMVCVFRVPLSREISCALYVDGPFGVEEIDNLIEMLRLQRTVYKKGDSRGAVIRVAGMVLDCWHNEESAEKGGPALYASMNELQTALSRCQDTE